MRLKRFFILFIAICSSYLVFSQEINSLSKGLHIETSYGYGFVMPHHKSIEYFLEDHIQTFDIIVSKATYGTKYWNQLYSYPYYGLGFNRSNLGNKNVFGYANALYMFIKGPFWGASNKINIGYQMSFGAAYLTKCFDIDENYENLAIASHINVFIGLAIQSSIPLSDRLAITNSARVTHFSNGAIKQPNKGLNIFTGTIGLIYQLNPYTPERIIKELPQLDDKNEYSIVYAAGVKRISRYENEKQFASSLAIDFNRNYSTKGRWCAGIDLFFDQSNKELSTNLDKPDALNTDLYQVGIHAGHDLVLGKFSIVINLGGYIYAPVETLAPIYTRTGFRYRINNKIITNLTLKSHWAKANLIEWGVGYVF